MTPGEDAACVLVVTDDEGAGHLVARILGQAGYAVAQVASPGDALARAAGEPPACTVVDLSTGIGVGLRLVGELRSHDDPAVAGTGVVLIARQAGSRLSAWQAGVDGFLVRPFHAEELVREVDAVLSRDPDERARHRADEQRAAEGN